ncbi:MAG: hypothetical protein JKY37_25775, partial [Nannocystaceae bacterium]|nr:hypothetical protein [Nannocystaceae bacterium]
MAKTVIPGAYGAPSDGGGHAAWQTQADLLADGREMLERWCRSTRFAHLYPDGPNFSILFESYQEFDRLRAIGRVPKGRWRQRRKLKQLLRRAARRDVVTRTSRIRWAYPNVEITAIAPSSIIQTALDAVDPDVRPLLAARLAGQPGADFDPATSMVTDTARQRRAEQQFRVALTNEALRQPDELLRLPAAVWPLLASRAPTKRRHPVATLIFIKFPLRLAVAVSTLLLVSYIGAWVFFNDAVLGRFISTRVSSSLEGELELGSIHWDLPLIADLITGRPTHVVVQDISVWEPYRSYGGTRKRRTAHAKELEVSLVLHEIIPWNRIGIPRFVDIPWVLHFPSVTSDEPMWITVREYEDDDDLGTRTTLLSLLDAFTPLDPNPDNKGLSFAIDAATLGTTIVEIDMGGDGGWGTTAQLSWVNFALHFEAPEPHAVVSVLPFSFEVEAMASRGGLHIGAIAVPYENLAIANLATGKGDVPLGDLGFVATVDAAGSTLALNGGLTNVFPGPSQATDPERGAPDAASGMAVTLLATTDDGEGLIEHVVAELQLPHGTVVAQGTSVQANVWGPVDSPQYRLRADSLAVDALGESGWAFDDLLVDLTLAEQPLP